jgi:general secretion pathway protein E
MRPAAIDQLEFLGEQLQIPVFSNREEKNVVTIEDPIEYNIDGITQVQVNPAVNLTFAGAIRAFLRQDPDIMFIGEIRDDETAKAAIQASLTGHLVLSTLHTNDASTAVSRLIEMEIEPFLISSSLSLVVSQRLVRKVCPYCEESIKATDVIKEFFTDMGVNIEYYKKGKGCEKCFNTGYKGRTIIYELLELNDDIRNLIHKKASAHEILNTSVKKGFKKMSVFGGELVKQGITTPEEVIAVSGN